MRPLEYGEPVILWETGKGRTFLVTLTPGGVFHSHRGVVRHDEVVGKPEGSEIFSSTGYVFIAFRPRIADRMMKVRRQTQIVYPKDAGWLALALDLFPGARVIEMGTGSGAFTILLAQFVGPTGRVYTFDRRPDFLYNALENIQKHGYADRVEAQILTAGEPFPVSAVDAVFLDLPTPWEAIPPAWQALAPGRPLALLVPTTEQLKQAVKTLAETGFVWIEAVELWERKMLVREREGIRPLERMVGFTGYLVSARKALVSRPAPLAAPLGQDLGPEENFFRLGQFGRQSQGILGEVPGKKGINRGRKGPPIAEEKLHAYGEELRWAWDPGRWNSLIRRRRRRLTAPRKRKSIESSCSRPKT